MKMKTNVGWLTMAAVVVIFMATGAAYAQNCSQTITMCGCTINSPGVYTVEDDLVSTQGLTSENGCIDVNASNVTLILNGHKVTGAGTGTGIGIHLMPETENIFLEATGTDGNGHSTGFTTVTGWGNGVLTEATNVIADGPNTNSNTVGWELNHAKNNNINDFGASTNTQYGVWLRKSSGNQINCSGSGGNGIAGVYVGCSSSGPNGQTCGGEEGEGSSTHNYIYDHGAFSNTQKYGVAIEKGSKNNVIMDVFAEGNTVDDLYDGNTNCDNNLWRSNVFTTVNQSCIH
jgi:hypothetical protein